MHEKQPPGKCSDQCFKAHSVGNSQKKNHIFTNQKYRKVCLDMGWSNKCPGDVVFGHCGNPINVSGQLPDTKQGLGIILVYFCCYCQQQD